MRITEDNFQLLAAKVYRKRICVNTKSFFNDLASLDVKADILKYMSCRDDKQLRLIINKLVIAVNLFGPDAVELILFKVPESLNNFTQHLFNALSLVELHDKDSELEKALNEALSRI